MYSMITKLSKAGVGMGMFVSALVYLGVPVELAEQGVAGLLAFIGLALWIWGQFNRSDLTWGIFRK